MDEHEILEREGIIYNNWCFFGTGHPLFIPEIELRRIFAKYYLHSDARCEIFCAGIENKNKRIYDKSVLISSILSTEDRMRKVKNEFRKFIEENKYGRIATPRGEISIPRIQSSESNGNNIKYDSRRLFDDMGK